MESGYLTANEVSHYLGTKLSTVYAMVGRKEIPHYRVGRLIKFKKADLDAFMEEHRIDRVDVDKEAKKILSHARNPNIDVGALVKKTVAENRGSRYTASHGKPDQFKGLRKEEGHGAL